MKDYVSIECDGESPALDDLKAAERFYDSRYRHSYMESWPAEKCARIRKLLLELPLPDHGRVLDFGCGCGVFTALLKAVLPKWEVYGIDISSAAVEIAACKLPDCSFHLLSECNRLHGTFDLIFSHHVLEHVSNISETAELLERLLAPGGAMLHILPCADPGSLEHTICSLRRDGFVGEYEKRFVLDEEGHLRRLTTEGLASLWSNYRVGRAYYANRLFGGLKFLTNHEHGFRDVVEAADPARAVDRSAGSRLKVLRFFLVSLWALRRPSCVIKNKLAYGLKSPKDFILLVLALAGYPLSKLTDFVLDHYSDREWSKNREQLGGSEMYVFFVRSQTLKANS